MVNYDSMVLCLFLDDLITSFLTLPVEILRLLLYKTYFVADLTRFFQQFYVCHTRNPI